MKLRRASTSDLDQQSICLEAEKGQSLKIKKRIKEFQKKHLLAAHEALWGVLGEMKAKGEVSLNRSKLHFPFAMLNLVFIYKSAQDYSTSGSF